MIGNALRGHPNAALAAVLATLVAALEFLAPSGRAAFPTLHALLEAFVAAVAAMIFAVAWAGRGRGRTGRMAVLGCGALAVAVLAMGHLLSYPGMPAFATPASPDKASAFWLAQAAAELASLAFATLLPWRACRGPGRYAVLAATLAAAGGLSLLLFRGGFLPALSGPAEAPTDFRTGAEACLLAGFATAALLLSRGRSRGRHLPYLSLAATALAFAESSLLFRPAATGPVDLFAHACQLLAGLLVLRAVYVGSVRNPFLRLQDSEARFRGLMEAAPDGILVVDAEGRIDEANRRAEALFGRRRGDLVGRPVEILLPERLRGAHAGRRRTFDAAPRMREMGGGLELRAVRADGSEFPVEVALSPLETAAGTWTMCVVRDITVRKEAEQALRRREEELRVLVETSPDVISRFDRRLRRVYVNPAVERLDGHPAAFYLGKTCREAGLPDAVADAIEGRLLEVFARARSIEFELAYPGPAGERHLLMRLVPETDAEGTVEHVVAVAADITARVRAEQENRRLASILEAVPDLVSISDADGRLVYLNPAGRDMLGLGAQDDLAALEGLPRPRWMQRFVRDEGMPQALSAGLWRNESVLLRRDGGEVPVVETLLAHRDGRGGLLYWSSVAQDTRERLELEHQLRHQATHDTLSGLPNRSLVLDRLQQAAARAGREERRLAVLLIDLDEFRHINETLGHPVGDELLVQVGHRLAASLHGSGATVGRLGGDEFAVLLDDADADQAAAVAGQLLADLAAPFSVRERSMGLSASVGIALFPGDGREPGDLLRSADMAMYEAKRRGRGGHCFFTRDLDNSRRERLDLREDLRRAVARNELLLHYQPKIDLATGRPCGMEALVRWQHPERGLIGPDTFIPLAEETGLILDIGAWVLHTACRQNRAWQDAGLPPLRMAVNLSARQFSGRDLAETVAAALRESGLEARHLELEITESMVMDNPEASLKTLYALKDLGVALSIDDFGTGYSSLSYLRRFPVDAIKVDRSFVRDVPANGNDAAIASAIISMAHRLGLKVVAEGVESERHVDFLRQHHCDEAQGFHFSRPVPAPALEALLREAQDAPGAGEPASRPTLLIVNHVPDTARILEHALQHDGYRILTAPGPAEALDLLARQAVHVIVCDYWMPKLPGGEFLRQARLRAPDAAAVLLGSRADRDDMDECVHQGLARAFLTEPWRVADLRSEVRAATRAGRSPAQPRPALLLNHQR